jgi:hypothetical protein
MQNGDYSFIWWCMVALKFVIPFVSLCMPVVRHNVQATVAVATCIIVGTLCERFVWIGGIHGTGGYPVLAFIVVAAVVAGCGYLLVKNMLHRNQLIKA